MNSNDIIKLNNFFEKINDETNIEYLLEDDINNYIKLKKELEYLENKINEKANSYGLSFNTKTCLLENTNKTKIFIRKYFKIDKKEKLEEENIQEVSEESYTLIKKYLKNDKEKIVQFLNDRNLKNIKELSDIPNFIKYFFCGICSENNIIEIKENYKNDENFIIYSVKFHQVENKIENIYGEISFILK